MPTQLAGWQVWLWLVSLYISQGVPFGFFTQALPVLLRQSGASLEVVGLSTLLALPWALKPLLGPAVDRWFMPSFGRRRSWLIPLQIASVACLVWMAGLELAESVWAVAVAVLLANLFAAAQDVAADALAIDILRPEQRGFGNSIQVAGYRLGMLTGGGALLWVLAELGWRTAVLGLAAACALCLIPSLLFREPESERPTEPLSIGKYISLSIEVFRRPLGLRWLLVLLTFKAGHVMSSSMLRPWLVDQGHSLTDIAQMMGLTSIVGGLLGAVAGGWVASGSDRLAKLPVLAALQACAVLGYLIPVGLAQGPWSIVLVVFLDHFVSGMATVTLFAVMMDAARIQSAAADYTAQAAVVVVSQIGASALAGFFAGQFGYGPLFAFSCSASFVLIVFLHRTVRLRALQSWLARASAVLLAFVLLTHSPDSRAQTEADTTDLGVRGGAFISKRILGFREVINTWGFRVASPSRWGIVEYDFFTGRGAGDLYHSLSFDMRFDFPIQPSSEDITLFAVLGLRTDYWEAEGFEAKFGGGWHFGGGLYLPIAGPVFVRGDFKYRLSPGQSVDASLGFFYRLGGAASSSP